MFGDEKDLVFGNADAEVFYRIRQTLTDIYASPVCYLEERIDGLEGLKEIDGLLGHALGILGLKSRAGLLGDNFVQFLEKGVNQTLRYSIEDVS